MSKDEESCHPHIHHSFFLLGASFSFTSCWLSPLSPSWFMQEVLHILHKLISLSQWRKTVHYIWREMLLRNTYITEMSSVFILLKPMVRTVKCSHLYKMIAHFIQSGTSPYLPVSVAFPNMPLIRTGNSYK